MEGKVLKGWSLEETIVNKEILSYIKKRPVFKGPRPAPNSICCLNCEKELLEGEKCVVLRDKENKKRAVFCSVECQRQYYFEKVVRKIGRRLLFYGK